MARNPHAKADRISSAVLQIAGLGAARAERVLWAPADRLGTLRGRFRLITLLPFGLDGTTVPSSFVEGPQWDHIADLQLEWRDGSFMAESSRRQLPLRTRRGSYLEDLTGLGARKRSLEVGSRASLTCTGLNGRSGESRRARSSRWPTERVRKGNAVGSLSTHCERSRPQVPASAMRRQADSQRSPGADRTWPRTHTDKRRARAA